MSLKSDTELKSYGTLDDSLKIEKPQGCWGVRHTFVILAFLGCANVYAMRVNLSVAIVAMVDNTGSSGNAENETQIGYQCPFPQQQNTENQSINQKSNAAFNWDAEQQGIILGAFFYGYIITQIPGGYLAEKYGGKWLFGIGVLVTAILTLLTPVAANAGVSAFIAVRVLMGLGEGVTWPAMQAMISKWLPIEERSRYSSVIWAGAQFGTVIALPISGALAEEVGWESVFYFFGVLGAVWFLFWLFLCFDSPATHSRISQDERVYIEAHIPSKNQGTQLPFPPLIDILKSPAFISLLMVHFGHNWGLYTLLTELPTYLSNIQHFPLKANGFISALPYLLMWLFSMPIGLLSDWLIESGKMKARNVRRLCNSIGHYGSALGLIGLAFTGCDKTAAIVWLCLSVCLNGAVYSGFQLNHVELSPNYAGTLFGITNMVANLTGFITPWVAGNITNYNQTLESWRTVFLITAAFYIIFNTIFVIFVRAEIQPWNTYWEQNNDTKSPADSKNRKE